MLSKTQLRVASPLLSLLTSLALGGCDDYGSDAATTNAVGPLGPASDGSGMPAPPAPGAALPAPAPATSPATTPPMPGSNPEGAPPVMGGLAPDAPSGGTGAAGASGDMGTPAMGAGGAANPPMAMGSGGAAGAAPEPPVVTPPVRGQGPCDLYAAANTPCVGAYSLVRALSSTYAGPLYQVRRGAPNGLQNTGSGGQTQNIGMLPSGFADGAAQSAFCGNQSCTVSVLYDQSGQGNHLTVAKAGCYEGTASEDDYESDAKELALMVGGNPVFGLFMRPHQGYRNNQAVNTPEGEEPAGMYSVVAGSGTRPNPPPACCWNFGIASRDNCYGPTGMMNALFFGRAFWGEGAGNGPWFMGDFEAGVWAGGTAGGIGRPDPFDVNQNNPSMTMNYAFGILKSRPQNYALRMGNAQTGNLTTAYDGPTPTAMTRWQMEGGIILGIGGDNSNSSQGTFFEGAITAGRPSDATDEAVFRNVQAAGYGR